RLRTRDPIASWSWPSAQHTRLIRGGKPLRELAARCGAESYAKGRPILPCARCERRARRAARTRGKPSFVELRAVRGWSGARQASASERSGVHGGHFANSVHGGHRVRGRRSPRRSAWDGVGLRAAVDPALLYAAVLRVDPSRATNG